MFNLKKLEQEIDLLLQPDDPRVKYQPTTDPKKRTMVIHWGQRKLLLQEIWFLTKYGNLSKNVIYVGAAPGTHIPYLSSLFPNHKFHLIDPQQFTMKGNTNNIKTYVEYFTNTMAEQFKSEMNHDYLFISDIRTGTTTIPNFDNYSLTTQQKLRQETDEQFELMVNRDHQWQQQWCQIMNPKKALLKFRCPYYFGTSDTGQYEYMDGLILKQQWAPPYSTESRLIPNDYFRTIVYDTQKYEDQFYYHNQYIRRNNIIHSQMVKGEGLTKNWDSAAEVLILGKYIQSINKHARNLPQQISVMSKNISTQINHRGRTLKHKNILNEKQFDFVDHVGKVGIHDII